MAHTQFMSHIKPVLSLITRLLGRYLRLLDYRTAMLLIPCLFIIASFSTSSPASATTIVLIKTENAIFVGADSKATNEYYRQRRDSFCKIFQSGNLMYAASGIVEDEFTGFSVGGIVDNAARRGGAINELAARINISLVQPLNDALIHFKKVSPDGYVKQISNHRGITLQLLLFGFENGVPVVYEKDFGEPNLKANKIPAVGRVIQCPGENCQEGWMLLALGSNTAINAYLRKNSISSQSDPVELIQKLITLQIKATPNEVGLPIDIVRYDATGVHWIQRKQECAY